MLQARITGRISFGYDRRQVANVMRYLVDVVPPGTCNDHLLVHRQHLRCPAIPMTPLAHEPDGGIALLAKPGLAPELQNRCSPFLARLKRVLSKHPFGDRPHAREVNAAIRHFRLHVGLHSWGALWIGGRGQRGTNRTRECGQGAGR